MNKIIAAVLISYICLLQIFSQDTANWRKGILIDEFIYQSASFPACHASTIAETPEGLIAAWFGGTAERNPDVCIYTSRRVNGTWTAPVLVADGIQSASLRYPTWNPVLYQIPGGDLLLFYKVGATVPTWWGEVKKSSDNGKTWSSAVKLPAGIFGPIKNKPVLLKNGILISGSSTEDSGWKIHFEISPDSGKTWTKTNSINDPVAFPAIQPTIFIHSDGSLQMLSRTKMAVIGESWSNDNGNTWSAISGIAMPQNSSGIDGVSLADGRHLLVYNHVKPPSGQFKTIRNPLNVAVSNDGKKWFASLVIAKAEASSTEEYSYPSVIQSADGFVHIVYTWRRTHIKYVKIDPSKLVMKEIIDEKWPADDSTTPINKIENKQSSVLEIFPNPSGDSGSLCIKVKEYQNNKLVINSISGKELKEVVLNAPVINLNKEEFKTGLYIVSLINKNNQAIATQKFVVL